MILQTRNLTLQHPGTILCRDLNLTVNPGECWAILGRNGCGKTTLIHALGGLHPPKGGQDAGQDPSVTMAGKALGQWSRRELARNLGILLQDEPGEFWGTVHEYVLLGRHPHAASLVGWQAVDLEMTARAIEQMELAGLADRLLVTLSGGERQRARIALLLAQSPKCYLLDEPLQHLDLRHQLGTMILFSELAKRGSSIAMVLHDIGWAVKFCNHALLLFDDGHAMSGSIDEVLKRDNLEALYHCNLEEFIAGRQHHFFPQAVPSV
ncbi:iron complex transport system ATP-binding protein [Nitrosospira multiformis ATCC 25196]|uniref:ABC transporter related protein n=1 Tax=Nitrosospira multiformis (strain ATCC 25196 / NCIMB 11849 / C 71) TaxID=323848 RepID=Q2YAN5_NITMU|nr:ABC transporter ATP-binding protein [Nitrosospira multiformis]ABB74186.1 ABC transporter related protein [Nitrosospira multiformis ATCC 25196]SEF46954.1 iron complex transport system ATP-binding protein [Nitrosospira multiformis ATCC 25196]